MSDMIRRLNAIPPSVWLVGMAVLIGVMTLTGPAEKTLGANVRVVYLHGVLVWTALVGIGAAAVTGLVGLITRRVVWHHWSQALGRTGVIFWIAYLPISMWAAQANWNGVFFAEPRWRLAFTFAIVGVLLQIGLALMNHPAVTSLGNLAYAVALAVALSLTPIVMHPAAPIAQSQGSIQLFFFTLFGLTLFAAWQMARWWRRGDAHTATGDAHTATSDAHTATSDAHTVN